MDKNIFIILPFKESLNPKISGAVSILIQDSLKYTKFKKHQRPGIGTPGGGTSTTPTEELEAEMEELEQYL